MQPRAALFVIGAVAYLGTAGVMRAQREMPPAWPYGQPQLALGIVPPQVAPQRVPAGPPAAPNPNAAPQPLRQAAGSKFQFTQQQIGNSFGPVDWFPEDHPPMPEIVAHGRPGASRACGFCHLPTGRGRPENAPVQGLPYDYIVQQMRDFAQGLRRSADPRKANTGEMESTAKNLTEDEIKDAARYFSSIKVTKYVRVVETDTVPTMRIQGEIYYPIDAVQKEPIGVRILETPEDPTEAGLRSARAGVIAYAPVGSIKRGEALATTGGGGKTTACGICHGPDLKGLGPMPNLAGRSPSYLARQMYDMKLGTRNGTLATLMKPVLANLTDADIVDLMAYVSSREP